jgi:hypothetical protein
LDDKNSYVGYYEIDDIMLFTNSILERTRKNNKEKKGIGLFNEPDYANRSNNGKLLACLYLV